MTTSDGVRPLRLRRDLRERLVAEAEARGVPPTWLTNRLVEEGLDNLVPAEEFQLTRRRAAGQVDQSGEAGPPGRPAPG